MIQMRAFFGAQDILDLINDGYAVVVAYVTKAQRNMHRETRKEDQKILFYIHRCVDVNVFDKIVLHLDFQLL